MFPNFSPSATPLIVMPRIILLTSFATWLLPGFAL